MLGPGLAGDGLDLDGSDGLTLPDPLALVTPATQKTISLWIKPPPLEGKTDTQIRTLIANGNFQLQLYRNGNLELFQPTGPLPGNGVINDQWNQVVVVFDTSQAAIYVNGQWLKDDSGSTNLGGENLLFGHHPTLPGFQGAMDQVEIFNRGLSAAEILAAYQAGVTQ